MKISPYTCMTRSSLSLVKASLKEVIGDELSISWGWAEEVFVSDVARIMYQLIDALNYMHKNDIIHCDLKPENIMCTAGNYCLTTHVYQDLLI